MVFLVERHGDGEVIAVGAMASETSWRTGVDFLAHPVVNQDAHYGTVSNMVMPSVSIAEIDLSIG